MEPSVAAQIEARLRVLLGLPFWGAGRAADLESFQFGPRQMATNRRGQTREVGSFALHVQCAWRIVAQAGIVVASRDRYYPTGDPERDVPDFAWDRPGANRCDERIAHFFARHAETPLLVEGVSVDAVGGLILTLSDGHALDIFPDDSLPEEHWRFFAHNTDQAHLVVRGQGLSEE